jgi:type IV secretion system protein VirB8
MDGPMPWVAEDLTDASREAFYAAARQRQAAAEKADRSAGRLWQIVGCAGVAMGLLGMGAALDVFHRTPLPEPPRYILMDKTTGAIDPPVTARDAPRLFNDVMRERAIRDFIVACQSYVPPTWASLDYHACMLMAVPAEQKRLAADMSQKGDPDYPPASFPNGYAMPSSFQQFLDLGSAGNPPNTTWTYEVRYSRTEVVNGQQRMVPYTARVDLQFHPELKISNADRLVNPTGIQVISFSTVKD